MYQTPKLRDLVAKQDALRAACAEWSRGGRVGPILYVVSLGRGSPPDAIGRVVQFFESCGFVIRRHEGQATVPDVSDQAVRAGAGVILLCADDATSFDEMRPLVRLMRTRDRGVFDVLAVGAEPRDTREGDIGCPHFVSPEDSDGQLVWLATFLLRSLGVGTAATRPMRFRVEGVVESLGLVFGRRLDAEPIQFVKESTLGGHAIERIDQPRSILPNGELDLEVFGFFLSDRGDSRHFEVGREVLLQNP